MPSSIPLKVNGASRAVQGPTGRSLLEALRDDLDLTGSHYGCGEGQCGACTVLVDDVPARACVVPVGSVGAKPITTIEGLEEEDGRLHPVQEAFLNQAAFQCGYCTPGMILSAVALLQSDPQPTEETINRRMSGNICRCGTYRRVIAAIQEAARKRKGGD